MVNQWTAPPVGGPVPRVPCDNRQILRRQQPWIQRTSGRRITMRDWIGDCTGATNQGPAPPGAAFYGTSGPGLNPWTRPICQEPACAIPPPANSVCHFCQYQQREEYQTWMRPLRSHITMNPPGKEIMANGHKTKNFLTRLCADCQIAEQLLITARTPGGMGVVLPAVPPNLVGMQNYPTNTCTCLDVLEGGIICAEHRADIVDDFDTPFDMPPGMVGPAPQPFAEQCTLWRDIRARRLERIAWDAAVGQKATANQARKALRKQRCRWRACRCGKEVVKCADAYIYQCMGCEGIVQKAQVPPAHMPAPTAGPLQVHMINSSAGAPGLSILGPYNNNEV
ncbi:hypothetical protein LTR86_000354 [Recurvomyces mirabilis]|nr:hypothetical protein LTR86_000354 [Recurvomyces mirabilis]